MFLQLCSTEQVIKIDKVDIEPPAVKPTVTTKMALAPLTVRVRALRARTLRSIHSHSLNIF